MAMSLKRTIGHVVGERVDYDPNIETAEEALAKGKYVAVCPPNGPGLGPQYVDYVALGRMLKTGEGEQIIKPIEGMQSKATTANPKDLLGMKKVSVTKLPAVAVLHGAHAMMDGAAKYGPYNWRAKKVVASIYIDAILRHVGAWFEGQEVAEDSGVHHLGHAIACAAILLDAQETGNLVDDRPVNEYNREVFSKVLSRLNGQIEAKIKAKAADEAVEKMKGFGQSGTNVCPPEFHNGLPCTNESFQNGLVQSGTAGITASEFAKKEREIRRTVFANLESPGRK